MSYPERKNYRAMKAAKQYMKRSYLFDTLVVLGGINFFGSCASIFISLPFFIISLALSIIMMICGYKASACYESKADSIMKSIGSAPTYTNKPEKITTRNNIIRVDFRSKTVERSNRCSSM